MKEVPILFSTEMVKAILNKKPNTWPPEPIDPAKPFKWQTRRVVKPQPPKELQFPYGFITGSSNQKEVGMFCWTVGEICDGQTHNVKPPCQPSDILWVREAWYYEEHMHDFTAGMPDLPSGRFKHRYIYRTSSPDYPVNIGVGQHGWRPSIHMPREAARLFLRVKSVRVQRLQDISEEDARAEGVVPQGTFTAKSMFIKLWNSLNEKRGFSWHAAPWVWVVNFERSMDEMEVS